MKAGRNIAKAISFAAFLATALGSASLPARSQEAAASYSKMAPLDQYLMTDRSAEIAMARSAAPPSISDDAEVMVLGRHGYEIVVKGKNGFVCLVERSWMSPFDFAQFWNPKMRGPICFNPPAVRSILPFTFKRTELVLSGISKEQMIAAIKASDAKGMPPLEPGAMSYMMSPQGYLNDWSRPLGPSFDVLRSADRPQVMGSGFAGHSSDVESTISGPGADNRVHDSGAHLVGWNSCSEGSAVEECDAVLRNRCAAHLARSQFDGTIVATLRLNPDPSHKTKARRVGHPENQMRPSRWCGWVGHPAPHLSKPNSVLSYSCFMLQENYVLVTEDELIRKVSDTENNFVERKTSSNTDGWLKTAVAFANSCPIGQPGILYVNVDDNGKVIFQPVGYDFEKLQKSISKCIAEAWPPIYFITHILNKNGSEFVAVVIYGSPFRPHFSGRAHVRVGPETRDASDEEYDKLIAQRSSKVRALQKLVGKTVYWESLSPAVGNANGTVVDCNQFFLTIDGGTYQRCFPVDWITISFDPSNRRYCLIAKG